jgi:hypothetical protein
MTLLFATPQPCYQSNRAAFVHRSSRAVLACNQRDINFYSKKEFMGFYSQEVNQNNTVFDYLDVNIESLYVHNITAKASTYPGFSVTGLSQSNLVAL